MHHARAFHSLCPASSIRNLSALTLATSVGVRAPKALRASARAAAVGAMSACASLQRAVWLARSSGCTAAEPGLKVPRTYARRGCVWGWRVSREISYCSLRRIAFHIACWCTDADEKTHHARRYGFVSLARHLSPPALVGVSKGIPQRQARARLEEVREAPQGRSEQHACTTGPTKIHERLSTRTPARRIA